MGISLSDLITLAKAGYTPGQVKELMKLDVTVTPATPEEPQAASPAPTEPKSESAEPMEATENEEKQEEQKDPIDYKQLYEKTAEELRTAQAANRKQDVSEDPEKPMKDLQDVIRTYM